MLHRPETNGPGLLDVLTGPVAEVGRLAELPLPAGPGEAVLALVPYRQLAERGFAAPDDGTPLLAMTVAERETVAVDDFLDRAPRGPVELSGGCFDVGDDAYAELVRRIVRDEIGTGEGANFVLKRTFVADLTDYGPATAPALFRRLLTLESGAYWTFLIHTGERTLVGATPERHVSVRGGAAVMNPISGTYRYPADGPTLDGVLEFLADRKEADELYMVLDEELKMMTRVCDDGPRVVGPYLKEMARLAHTEYFIEGRTRRDVREVLRETLFAPTVTGSPVESAARVIERYEPGGRAFYSGVAALIGWEDAGSYSLDSAILIRTAEIDGGGRLRLSVGATLVRHSDAESEAAETRVKADGLLRALGAGGGDRASDAAPRSFEAHPHVRGALEQRNASLARFWLADGVAEPLPGLTGARVLIVDAEDTFTAMLGRQLDSLGLDVTVRRFDEPYAFAEHDLVVLGPGPGDPRDVGHPKIAHLRGAVDGLIAARRPFLAVCLSHQVLATRLGFAMVRREVPNQGVQREIELFGSRARVGFYNTFAARSHADRVNCVGAGPVEVSRDADSGEVHALLGAHFASVQFHPESVLTQDGPQLVGGLLAWLRRPVAVG
ncbi:anthranilate synthase family protein [Streptomyces sp. 7R007]